MACGRFVDKDPKCDGKESSENPFMLIEHTQTLPNAGLDYTPKKQHSRINAMA